MIKIQSLSTLQDIQNIILQCAADLFDQTLNTPENLHSLATKFTRYANVAVAYDEDQVAGFVAYYCNDETTKVGFISIIVIKGLYQGKGIGSILYNQVVDDCRFKGFDKIRLEVAKANSQALSFYNKKGFVKVDEFSNSFILECKI